MSGCSCPVCTIARNAQSEQEIEVDVTMINRAQGFALLNTGFIVPVTNWFDLSGEDCGPEEAVTCVAGLDAIGWFTIDLDDLQPVVMH